jgi:hypothetical protein
MDVLDSFLVTILAGLPGALFTFAYERQTRIVWAAVSDRIMRWSGRSPDPRAWDAAFGHGANAWLRIRLKDPAAGTDGWLLGVFGPGSGVPSSVASSYPDPPDLYLAETAEAESGTGRFTLDEQGRPKLHNTGLLIAWDETAYIELGHVPLMTRTEQASA